MTASPGPAFIAGRREAECGRKRPAWTQNLTCTECVGDVLKDVDFKNPNSLSQADYNTYSGAAIAGTLALFLPLLLVFDVSGFVLDFVLSALLGGGLGAGLALSKGGASDAANKFGATVLSTVDKVL